MSLGSGMCRGFHLLCLLAVAALGACTLTFDETLLGTDANGCPRTAPVERVASLNADLGCDGDLGACVAGAAPFLLIGTTSQVLALPLTTRADPRPIAALTGLAGDWETRALVTGGGRLFAAGAARPQADATNPTRGQFPLVWGEIPTEAQATFAVKQEIVELADFADWMLLPGPRDTLFVTGPVRGARASATWVQLPLREGQQLLPFRTEQSEGETTIGASGNRLLVRTASPAGMRIVQNAGTPRSAIASPQLLGDVLGTDLAAAESYQGSALDGAFVGLFPTLAAGSETTIGATTFAVLLDDDLDFVIATAHPVAIETYAAPPAVESWEARMPRGRLAFAGNRSVWVLARSAEDAETTSVTLVSTATTPPTIVAGSRALLPGAPHRHALVNVGAVVYVISRPSSGMIKATPLLPPVCR